jgi:hypothetical protein
VLAVVAQVAPKAGPNPAGSRGPQLRLLLGNCWGKVWCTWWLWTRLLSSVASPAVQGGLQQEGQVAMEADIQEQQQQQQQPEQQPHNHLDQGKPLLTCLPAWPLLPACKKPAGMGGSGTSRQCLGPCMHAAPGALLSP